MTEIQPTFTAPPSDLSAAFTAAQLFVPASRTSNLLDNPAGLLSGLGSSASGVQSSLGTSTLVNGATTANFLVSGETTGPVLVRAVGSSLMALGLTGSNVAPRLELYQDSQLIASNTGWMSALNASDIAAAAATVGASPLSQSGADSALYLTLAPGSYTASVSSPLDFSSDLFSDDGLAFVIEVYQFP